MLQTFTDFQGILASPERLAFLGWQNIVVRYGQVGSGITPTFDLIMWTCSAQDSRT